jgi:uncharacterized protein (TIGR04255 family)
MEEMQMTQRIPVRLKREPLLEAVWEIRFQSSNLSVGDLLPGFIYKALSGRYPDIVRLPVADLPAPIVEQDISFKYAPRFRLAGTNQAIQVGGYSLSLSCRRPYSGWKTFSADILDLISVLKETGLIDHLERFSLKYLDLIELDQPPNLNCLNIELKVGSHEISTLPLNLRTEIQEGPLVHVVHILSPAEASLQGDSKKLAGVLLDIDTIRPIGERESWDVLGNDLDEAHSASKAIFFSLLTEKTLLKLEPQY